MRKNIYTFAATLTVAGFSLLAAMALVAGRGMPAGPGAAAQLINPFELMARVRDLPAQELEDFSTVY
jgi:hypothetical protein